MCLSGSSTLSSFIEDDLEDLDEDEVGEGEEVGEEEEEEDEDATQWSPGPNQKSSAKLPTKTRGLLIEWLTAYRKRFGGSVKYRVLPESTIIIMATVVPLTLEVGGVGVVRVS